MFRKIHAFALLSARYVRPLCTGRLLGLIACARERVEVAEMQMPAPAPDDTVGAGAPMFPPADDVGAPRDAGPDAECFWRIGDMGSCPDGSSGYVVSDGGPTCGCGE